MSKIMTSMLLDQELVDAKKRLCRTYAELVAEGIKAIDAREEQRD
jgi:hypothetical protein